MHKSGVLPVRPGCLEYNNDTVVIIIIIIIFFLNLWPMPT